MHFLASQLRDEKARSRFTALVFASFAALALALALVGVYGITAYGVSRRVGEIGLRVALGARPQHVVMELISRGMLRVGLGAAAGVVVSIGFARLLTGLLFGVEPLDRLTLAAMPLSLMAIALFASYLPARRAARIDPMITMRQP